MTPLAPPYYPKLHSTNSEFPRLCCPTWKNELNRYDFFSFARHLASRAARGPVHEEPFVGEGVGECGVCGRVLGAGGLLDAGPVRMPLRVCLRHYLSLFLLGSPPLEKNKKTKQRKKRREKRERLSDEDLWKSV